LAEAYVAQILRSKQAGKQEAKQQRGVIEHCAPAPRAITAVLIDGPGFAATIPRRANSMYITVKYLMISQLSI
jgi:hypothetical protein